MSFVKVRNLNVHPFEQKYQGKLIHLGPMGAADDFVEMEYEDAIVFLGMFSPFKMDNKGQHDPKFYKMLKIEKDPNEVVGTAASSGHGCPACKEQTSSWLELEAHMRLMHSDSIVKDVEYEKYLAQKAKDHAGKQASAGANR